MSLKDQIAEDISGVFLVTDDFATEHTIKFGDKEFVAKCVIDEDTLQEKVDAAAQGVYIGEKLVYIASTHFDGKPAIGSRMVIDGQTWWVRNVIDSIGMYEIRLGVNRT